ncbi:MAG: MarR family transcriptional regulator [Acidobacteriota bacterium]
MAQRSSRLEDEIHQTRPFRSTSQEAALSLFRTADIIRRKFSQVLEPKGVTQQQYNVLRILRGAGEDGLNTLAIGERMVERTPGITRLIDRLEKKSWVERQRAPGDRRCVVCRITPSGLQLLAELEAPMNDADDQALSMLSQSEQEQLVELLDRIRDGQSDP